MILDGIKESARISNIISTLNIGTLLFSIIAEAFYVDTSKYYSDFAPFDIKGIFSEVGLAFFAFLEFEELLCFAKEATNPEHDMPIALFVVLMAATFLNSSVALIMIEMTPLFIMATNESLLVVFRYACPGWMSLIISIGSIAGLTANTFALFMFQARTFFSVAYDGLLPQVLVKINPKTKSPDSSVIATEVIVATMSLLFDVDIAGNAVSICGLIVREVVDLSVIISRYESKSSTSLIINVLCFFFIGFSYSLDFLFTINFLLCLL
jgi:APA family basic amino acid/polyamine antiporter